MRQSGFAGFLQGLGIQMGEHEYRAVTSVLYDGRNEARRIKARGEDECFIEVRVAHLVCLGNCIYASPFPYQQSNRSQTSMIDEIYNRKILEFAADIPHLERLAHPDATAIAHSKLCGSKVIVDLAMKDGMVSDFGQDVKACALGQASSSIMGRHVLGSSGPELRQVREQMYKMLKEEGAPPTGKWAELEALLPVRDYKARHASTLLTFDAVVDAVNQIETKHDQATQRH